MKDPPNFPHSPLSLEMVELRVLRSKMDLAISRPQTTSGFQLSGKGNSDRAPPSSSFHIPAVELSSFVYFLGIIYIQ